MQHSLSWMTDKCRELLRLNLLQLWSHQLVSWKATRWRTISLLCPNADVEATKVNSNLRYVRAWPKIWSHIVYTIVHSFKTTQHQHTISHIFIQEKPQLLWMLCPPGASLKASQNDAHTADPRFSVIAGLTKRKQHQKKTYEARGHWNLWK